jgi:hypothetical protein
MLCCVGLFGGLYVGQSLGGHWTITAPAIGFGLGLFGDTKLMRGMHGHNTSNGDHNTKMSSYDSSLHLPRRNKRKFRYYKVVISTQERSGGIVVSAGPRPKVGDLLMKKPFKLGGAIH